MQHFELETSESEVGDGNSTVTQLFSSPKSLVTEPSQKRKRTDESSSPPTPVSESEFGPDARSVWAFTSRIVGPLMEKVITPETADHKDEERNEAIQESNDKANEDEETEEEQTDKARLNAKESEAKKIERQAHLRSSRQKGLVGQGAKTNPSADVEEVPMSSRQLSLRSSSSAPVAISFDGMPARVANKQSRTLIENEFWTNWNKFKETEKVKQLKRPNTSVNSAPVSPPPRSMTPRIQRATSAENNSESQVGTKAITVAEFVTRKSSPARRSARIAGHSPSPSKGDNSDSELYNVTSTTRIRDSAQLRHGSITVDSNEDEGLYRLLPIPSSQPEAAESSPSFVEEYSNSTPKIPQSVTIEWAPESARTFTPSSFEATSSHPVADIGLISQDEQRSLSRFSPRGRSNTVASLQNNSESGRASSIRWSSPTSSFQPINRPNMAPYVRKKSPEAFSLSQGNTDNRVETPSTSINPDAQKPLFISDSHQQKQTFLSAGSSSSGRATQESETYLLLHGSQEPISVDQSTTLTANQVLPTQITLDSSKRQPETRARRRSPRKLSFTSTQLKPGNQDVPTPSVNSGTSISEHTTFRPSNSTDFATFLPYTDFSFAANSSSELMTDSEGKCVPA